MIVYCSTGDTSLRYFYIMTLGLMTNVIREFKSNLMLSKNLSLAPSSYCEAQFKNHQTITSKILREKTKSLKFQRLFDGFSIYYLYFCHCYTTKEQKNKLLQFTYIQKRTSKENLVAMSYKGQQISKAIYDVKTSFKKRTNLTILTIFST